MPRDRTQNQPSIRVVDKLRSASAAQPSIETIVEDDSLEVSEREQELARAQRAVEAAPDVRSDKVAQLKKQVEEGAYNVPTELLADKLLETNGGQ